MSANREPHGPLAGIRVLDLATSRAELGGRLLADLGAEVIKVEPPGGSPSRRFPPFDEREGHESESLYWATVALGKHSVVLDITTPTGQDALRRLVTSADILIESFDPGFMTSLGLGYEQLSAIRPELIYASVTPFGQTGPYANRIATDLTLEASGGLLGLQGDNDRPPVPVGYPQASFHGGAQAAADSVIALNERARSGRGQHLDVSMQAAMVWTLMNATGYPPNTGDDPPNTSAHRTNPPPELAPGVVFPAVFEAKDGWVQSSLTIGGLGARTIRNFLRRMERDGILAPEYSNNGWLDWADALAPGSVDPATLTAARDEIIRIFRSKCKEELLQIAVEEQMLFAPIRTVDELLRDPQLQARDYWQEVGGRTHPGVAVKMNRTPMQLGKPAPALGADQHLVDAPATSGFQGTATAAPRARAFEGLRVADFAWVGVGPIIAKALADHGATVVHVESTSRPDALRLGPPFRDNIPGLSRSQFQANYNTSKLGLELNLSLPSGRDLAHKLVDWADVVIESFAPGVIDSLGLGWEHISATRPDIILLSTCLYGQTGPYARLRGFGTQGACLAGLHGITGWPDRPPKGTWGAYTDFIAPRYGISAIAAAIAERRQSGLGQRIDLSQVEAGIHFLEPLVLDYTVNGRAPSGPSGHDSARACPHGVYQAEGKERYLAIAVEEEAHWQALTATVPGLSPFAQLDSYPARLARRDEIDRAIRAWCAPRDAFEAVDVLLAAGVPASVIARPSDLYNDPQLAHRGFFVTCEHAVMGPTPYDGPVTSFSATPPQLTAGPIIGEHNDYVLSEILRLDPEQIAEAAIGEAFS